jgi:hypothetical protein
MSKDAIKQVVATSSSIFIGWAEVAPAGPPGSVAGYIMPVALFDILYIIITSLNKRVEAIHI